MKTAPLCCDCLLTGHQKDHRSKLHPKMNPLTSLEIFNS